MSGQLYKYGHRCWSLVSHLKLFWHSTFSHTKVLGKLAYRVFCCPVNSVASEHAFSVQNLIYTTSRNSLQSERADKLVYLHINARHVSQFDFDLTSELKSKRRHDLTLQLMGEELHREAIEDSIDSKREENAENVEKVAKLKEVSDEDDEF